jgi:hypothetical protein
MMKVYCKCSDGGTRLIDQIITANGEYPPCDARHTLESMQRDHFVAFQSNRLLIPAHAVVCVYEDSV